MSRRETGGVTRMPARLALSLLLGLSGCGGDSPGKPSTPVAPIEGTYSLRVEASPFCSDLPVRAFDFSVTATEAPSGSGWRLESFNEFGVPGITFDLAPDKDGRGSVAGRLEINFETVALPMSVAESDGNLEGLFNARGEVTPGPGGRSEVARGTLVGTLELSWFSAGVSHFASCADADHAWSLTAR